MTCDSISTIANDLVYYDHRKCCKIDQVTYDTNGSHCHIFVILAIMSVEIESICHSARPACISDLLHHFSILREGHTRTL